MLTYNDAKRIWLEIAMELPRLQYLSLLTACRHQPPLRNGKYHFDLATTREYEMEEVVQKFAQAAVDKFAANSPVPFRVGVASPTYGP
jgi:hypothetical protein